MVVGVVDMLGILLYTSCGLQRLQPTLNAQGGVAYIAPKRELAIGQKVAR